MNKNTSSIRHQLFDYSDEESFLIYNINSASLNHLQLLNHWHAELEMNYTFSGRALHRIDGETFYELPGRLIVTNPESVHSIVPDREQESRAELVGLVLLFSVPFLEENFPEYPSVFFTNRRELASPRIRDICLKLSEYARWSERTAWDKLYAKGMMIELLALAAGEDSISRSEGEASGGIRRSERLKTVLQYIEDHYSEPILLSDIAKLCYFSPEYFSRYFRKNTGVSFSQYLRRYRLQIARKDLLGSDKSILEIALKNGFTDERGLIRAFKEQYGSTPLQYRKERLEK